MKNFKLITVLTVSIVMFGCASSVPVVTEPVEDNESYTMVDVFFATDRAIDNEKDVYEYYGAERADVTYGITQVSIPQDHEIGALESPTWWKFEFSEDPDKHVILQSISQFEKENYFEKLKGRVGVSSDNDLLIYVHGYNVTFSDAARRTAQMVYDLSFDGAAVFYSWPSHGKMLKYTSDEVNVQWTQANITAFLKDVVEKSDAENIYLIAHSMGNRALTRSYVDLMRSNPEFSGKVREVILAAPDIDADVFKRDIAPEMVKSNTPITLYASSEDIPLQVSREVHAGYPRAGDAGENLVVLDGVETIDATNVGTGFLDHSYYAEERPVISDIFNILHHSMRASDRAGLTEIQAGDGVYWKFRR
ncbi:alpha/beta hydrolase [Vibrio coralliirubri]|uniref:alpha/beta hydrolase n=1 Tax=Vibrio coralliirubri TaxID=1516159 RepID=UPI000A38F187|nr:alpha/beta fold hydrolase [Vibrio coralliirubri]